MADICSTCDYYDENDTHTWIVTKGYCKWYRGYMHKDDSCSHYSPKHNPNNGCYITTIVCDILGYPDNHPLLNSFRNFRDTILQKDCKYIPLLSEYDLVGPIIAQNLKEENNKDFCQEIMISSLLPTHEALENGDIAQGIDTYKEMTDSLREHFGIPQMILNLSGYDYAKGGHGKIIRALKPKEEQ